MASIAAMALVGLFVGSGVESERSQRADARRPPWQSLGAPPERAVKIVAADRSQVFVQTAGGRIYECCWKVASAPPEALTHSDDCPMAQGEAGRAPEPPGTVVDSLRDVTCRAETAQVDAYVLLDDGSIWAWHRSLAADFGSVFIVLGGAAIGAAVGFVAVVVFWSVRARRSTTPTPLSPPSAQPM